jgi:hypothetical protein
MPLQSTELIQPIGLGTIKLLKGFLGRPWFFLLGS